MKKKLLEQIKRYFENNKKSFLKKSIEEDYEKGVKEFKEASKIKSFVFFVLGIIMTCTTQFIIYKIHPSNFTGQKLEQYLIDQICDEYGFVQRENVRLQNISIRSDVGLEESDTLFLTGKYEDQCTFIAIFSKGNKKFSDFIFSTNSKYELVKKFYSEKVSNSELYFSAFNCEDLDGDGIDEVIINLDSEYASYAPRYTLVFKGQKDTWNLLEPNLSALEQKVSNSSEEYLVFLKNSLMYSKDEEEDPKKIYGLFNYGELEFYQNTFYNYYDFYYRVSLLKPEQSVPDIDTFAYLMLRIDADTNELVIERNWNNGEVMISALLSENDVYYNMGYWTDGHVFYDPIPQ